MSMLQKFIIRSLCFIMISFTSICFAQQQIDVIVSASAGGPNDIVTRKTIEMLEKNTNYQFVILNKPGAAHTIAYNYMLTVTKPTLLFSTPEIVNHEVYNHLDDLYTLGYFTNDIYVSKKSGINNLKDLYKVSKTREIVFGHGGVGTYSHKAMENMCKSQIKCLSIPYKSGAEGMLALMSGQIDAYAVVSYSRAQYSENDKLKFVHSIKADINDNWFKVFSKNISNEDNTNIARALKSIDSNFYKNMGFQNKK